MISKTWVAPLAGLAALCCTQIALGFELDLRGSLGKHGQKRYVPPLSNPLLNETPYITTEARPIYFYNDIPHNFLTRGGHIEVMALELRLALTERLGLIASKDGYVNAHFKEVLDDDQGFANVSIGLKYALVSDPETDTIVTAGIEYEAPTGDVDTGARGINDIRLQGKGDGFIDVFVTGARAFGKLGVQGNFGMNFALNPDQNSSLIHASGHLDYELFRNFFPLVELNFFDHYSSGERTPVNFEGIDVVNFGATDPGEVTTAAVGARYRFNEHIQLGVGYEEPIGTREDIMNWRAYADLVISY